MLSRFLIKLTKLIENHYVCNVYITVYINKTCKDIKGKFSSSFISHILYWVSILRISFIILPLLFIPALCGPINVCNLCSLNEIKQILILLFNVSFIKKLFSTPDFRRCTQKQSEENS